MAVRPIPKEFVPGTAVQPDGFGNVEGARLAVEMHRGEVLIRGTLEGADTSTFSTQVQTGVRAITLTVDEVNSISGLLQPHDRVDLFFTAKPPKVLILDIGLPETLDQGHRESPDVRARPAAFLDRNVLADFARRDPKAFQWTQGAVEAIRTLNDCGYYVFVMSHPSEGLTRVAPDKSRLNATMQDRLAAEGAHIDRFYGEPDYSPEIASKLATDSATGKTDSTLFLAAMNQWPVVRERSFFLGVSSHDVEAARSVGVAGQMFDAGDLARDVHSLLAETAQSLAVSTPST